MEVLDQPMSNLLALDQSSHITGWAVFKDGHLFKYGKFALDEASVDVRLTKIKKAVADLISEYQIDEVVYEDIQQQNNIVNNVQTFKILAEVYGVLSEYFESINIPHTSVLASSWKSTLGIKGKGRTEQKQNAQKYVIEKYGIKPTQDIVDAICIGVHYLIQLKGAWSS